MTNLYVRRLQRFAQRYGGRIEIVAPGCWSAHPASDFSPHPMYPTTLGCSYERRIIYVLGPLRVRRASLIDDLVHEMWHVFGSPLPPRLIGGGDPIGAESWEFALLRLIGYPLTRWRVSCTPRLEIGRPPKDDPVMLAWRDQVVRKRTSTRSFLRWATAMIERGKRCGITVHLADGTSCEYPYVSPRVRPYVWGRRLPATAVDVSV